MAWAPALACYKELATHYESTTMDFAKLSRAQSSMARIYDFIAKGGKQFPRYFRVVYKGLGFPASLRDKEFIFEGSASERMASFVDRKQREHPTAQIMSSGEIPDYEGQFLQITSVSAHRDVAHPVYQRSKVPHSVREHLLISDPARFSSTSRRHTSSSDVREQYVEKLIFTAAESFPNILRRSEIVSAQEIALSPLQTALERTCRKTQELQLLERRAASGEDSGLSNLTEALDQLLESRGSSPNCVAMYRVFLGGAQGTKEKQSDIAEEDDEEQDEEEEESGAEVGVGMGVRAKWKRNDDGESASGAEGTCGFDEHFDDHVAVFDLTFCVSAPFCVPRLICVANGEADDVMDGRIILG